MKITFAINNKADYVADNIQETNTGVSFEVAKVIFKIGILGKSKFLFIMPCPPLLFAVLSV